MKFARPGKHLKKNMLNKLPIPSQNKKNTKNTLSKTLKLQIPEMHAKNTNQNTIPK